MKRITKTAIREEIALNRRLSRRLTSLMDGKVEPRSRIAYGALGTAHELNQSSRRLESLIRDWNEEAA